MTDRLRKIASTIWSSGGPWVVALAVGAVVARLVRGPAHLLLGHVHGEAPGHLWMQWLLERALWEGAPWFGQTDVLLDETLWVVPLDWTNRLFAVVVGLVCSPVFTYNLTAVGLCLLLAVGAVRVGRTLGLEPGSRALLCLLVVWSPAVLGFLADGRIDSMCLGWMALFLASWLDAMRSPSWRVGIWMGLWAGCTVLSGPNPAFVLAVLAAGPSLWALVRKPARIRPLLVCVGMTLVPAALFVGCLLYVEGNDPMRLQQESLPGGGSLLQLVSAEEIQARHLKALWSGAAALNRHAVDGSMWSLPDILEFNGSTQLGVARMTLQPFAPGGWWRLSVVPWVLAGLGLLRRPRAVAPWVTLGALCAVLGLGHGSSQTLPFVWNGQLFYVVPAAILERVPGFGAFNNYGLFSSVSALLVAVAAGVGLHGVRWSVVVAGGAALVWFAEVQRGPVPLPLAVADTHLPDGFVEALTRSQVPGAVVLLPRTKDHNNLLQTLHGRPTPVRFRLQAAVGQDDGMYSDRTGAIARLNRIAQGELPSSPHLQRNLRGAGVGLVVFAPSLLTRSARPAVSERVREVLGRAVWSDGNIELYELSDRRTTW